MIRHHKEKHKHPKGKAQASERVEKIKTLTDRNISAAITYTFFRPTVRKWGQGNNYAFTAQ